MTSIPSEFSGVTVLTKANVYYDGKVISHPFVFPDGSRKTLGVILPGSFHFGTGQPEQIQLVSGSCLVKLDGENEARAYREGDVFMVEGNSGFEVSVDEGVCEYLCSFLT